MPMPLMPMPMPMPMPPVLDRHLADSPPFASFVAARTPLRPDVVVGSDVATFW